MRIAGVDPGLHESHAASLRYVGNQPSTVYGAKADLIRAIKGRTPSELVAQLAQHPRPDLVLIEMARGSIASARDADPVLQNNLVAGEIRGLLLAAGIPAVLVASGGDATPWNWRTSLGVRGKGADLKDQATCQIVSIRLNNPETIPKGARGGHQQHWYDAAGVALAGLDRVLAKPLLSPEQAVNFIGPLEEMKLNQRRLRKNANKHRRAAKGQA